MPSRWWILTDVGSAKKSHNASGKIKRPERCVRLRKDVQNALAWEALVARSDETTTHRLEPVVTDARFAQDGNGNALQAWC